MNVVDLLMETLNYYREVDKQAEEQKKAERKAKGIKTFFDGFFDDNRTFFDCTEVNEKILEVMFDLQELGFTKYEILIHILYFLYFNIDCFERVEENKEKIRNRKRDENKKYIKKFRYYK